MAVELANHIGAIETVDAGAEPVTPSAVLPRALGDELDRIAVAVRGRLNKIRQEIVVIGQDLHRAKALLKRGQWMPWLSAEFGMTARTAENYMNVAERFGEKFERLSNLRLETAYKLAARSTPSAVVEAVLARAFSAEGLSDRDAAAMLPKAGRPRTEPAFPAIAHERPLPPNIVPEPTTVAGEDAAPKQQFDPESGEGGPADAVSPSEPLSQTLPSRSRKQVQDATLKAFEQLKLLKPERLRLLCPALRVCDPAELAGMLEKFLAVKTGVSG